MTSTDLLIDLGRTSDLARLVERVARDQLPWVVVSSAAVTAWMQRDPDGWAKVSAWLAELGVPPSPVRALATQHWYALHPTIKR